MPDENAKEPTRADDERLLRWLRLRARGWTPTRIAAREGVTRMVVTGALWRVDRDSAPACAKWGAAE